ELLGLAGEEGCGGRRYGHGNWRREGYGCSAGRDAIGLAGCRDNEGLLSGDGCGGRIQAGGADGAGRGGGDGPVYRRVGGVGDGGRELLGLPAAQRDGSGAEGHTDRIFDSDRIERRRRGLVTIFGRDPVGGTCRVGHSYFVYPTLPATAARCVPADIGGET